MDAKNKERRKRRYRAMAYGNKKKKFAEGKNVIQESLQGFILVCNGKEKEAIREAYKILNETVESQDLNKEDSDDDIETALAKEKALLSSENKNFQLCYTAGVANFMFMKSQHDPLPIALEIVESILKSGEQRTRYLIRLVPIQTVCKAYPDPIRDAIKTLISKLELGTVTLTYCVAFKTRFNNNLTQNQAYDAVNEAVKEMTNSAWSVQFKEPDYVIVLEVVTSYCCIGILPQYQQRKKFNLIELAKIKDSSISSEKNGSTADGGSKIDEAEMTSQDSEIKVTSCTAEDNHKSKSDDEIPKKSSVSNEKNESNTDGAEMTSQDSEVKVTSCTSENAEDNHKSKSDDEIPNSS